MRVWPVVLLLFAFSLAAKESNSWVSFAPGNLQSMGHWVDQSQHPLNVSHHYFTFGKLDAGMGVGWTHSWKVKLEFSNVSSDGVAFRAVVRQGNGEAPPIIFSRSKAVGAGDGLNVWQPYIGRDILEQDASGHWIYRSTSDGKIWKFDESGSLLSISSLKGWSYLFENDDKGRLRKVTNAFGRQLNFQYAQEGRLESLLLPDGNSIKYAYDERGRLSSIAISEKVLHRFDYLRLRKRDLLKTVYGADGNELVSYEYNNAGLPSSVVRNAIPGRHEIEFIPGMGHLGKSGAVDFSFNKELNWNRSAAIVKSADAEVQRVEYVGSGGGLFLIAKASAQDGLLKNASLNSSQLAEYINDFNGNVTRYQWDVKRRLPIEIKSAFNLPEEKTVKFQWHADFHLPEKIIESERLFEFSYDHQGNLHRLIVGDLVAGREFVNIWQYNSRSLLSSSVDALGRGVSFEYDEKGNLIRHRQC